MKWGHDQLAHDLAEHLRGNTARMVWEDMQMGPSGSARPDVFTMNKSYSSPKPLVYEVKVSVSDFRSDVTSGKWQKYREFSSGVIFAVPQGLVTKADVPPGCGLIVRSENVWRTVKGPTLGECVIPQKAMLKLLIDGAHRQAQELRVRQASDWCAHQLERAGLAKDVAQAVQDLRMVRGRIEDAERRAKDIISSAQEKAESLKRQEDDAIKQLRISLCEALSIEPNTYGAQDIVELAANFSDYAKGLRAVMSADKEVKRLQDQLDNIMNALDRAGVAPAGKKWNPYWR